MISINNMSYSYGDKLVLKDVNIEIRDNVLLGLVGINGAGKSTFLRLLSGILEPTQGEILIDGMKPINPAARSELFLLPDEPYFNSNSTIESLVKLYKAVHPLFDEALCNEIAEFFKLRKNAKIKNFSKGMRRQAFIALAFGVAPKYLFLDEAFDGLDPVARKRFKEYVMKLKTSKDITVIVSSHSLLELDSFCEEFLMIDSNVMRYSDDNTMKGREICKFRVVFKDEVGETVFDALPYNIISVKSSGHVVEATFEGREEDVLASINSLNPLVVDKLTANFEDRFISDFS